MNWKTQKIEWIEQFAKESHLEDDDEIDMELLVEWLAKKHCTKAENLPISDVSVSNVDIKDLRGDLVAAHSMIGEIVEGVDEGKNLIGYCIHRLDAGGYSR